MSFEKLAAPPRVFLPKSPQRAEIARDKRNCELRRVRKRLKIKDGVFALCVVEER